MPRFSFHNLPHTVSTGPLSSGQLEPLRNGEGPGLIPAYTLCFARCLIVQNVAVAVLLPPRLRVLPRRLRLLKFI